MPDQILPHTPVETVKGAIGFVCAALRDYETLGVHHDRQGLDAVFDAVRQVAQKIENLTAAHRALRPEHHLKWPTTISDDTPEWLYGQAYSHFGRESH